MGEVTRPKILIYIIQQQGNAGDNTYHLKDIYHEFFRGTVLDSKCTDILSIGE